MSPREPKAARALEELRGEAAGCTNCPLYRVATQTVFGEGSANARLMLVGKQPGDQEDRAGQPFVGPAGRVLDDALERAGIDPAEVFTTNVVKHFKFVSRGKRRIHQRPKRDEIEACLPWLHGELSAVRPAVVVALGATAAKALIGSSVRVTKDAGELFERDGLCLTPTLHPSAVLRAPDSGARAAMLADLSHDLRAAALAARERSG